MQVKIIKALSDNYVYLISWKNNALVIDPSDGKIVLDELEKANLTLLYIFNTHHHFDHIGGNDLLLKKTGCKLIAPDDDRIPKKSQIASENCNFHIDGITVRVIFVPGHTTTHVAYYIPEKLWLFTGDTLFLGGCGRLFEGTYEMMHASLTKLSKLPPKTLVFCGHEYTLNNLLFTQSIEPENEAIKKRLAFVKEMKTHNTPTVPATLEEELCTNPFLRTNQTSLKKALGMENASDLEVFTKVRRMKDDF